MLHPILEIAFTLLSFSGLAFSVIGLWSAHLFDRERKQTSGSPVSYPVSILKPLKGVDLTSYDALRSHCLQHYAAYEILFGINDADDPAAGVVRKIIAEFPALDIRLIVCGKVFGTNRKVSNLIHLLREARYEHVLVNDGDITVSPGYLQSVMAGFSDPEVGMVTCLYRGNAAGTLGSRLEALGIAADFIPGVLTARLLEGALHFGLGSTLAMTRPALNKIGGFAAVVDYLADDYQLGERIAASGFKIALAKEVVETAVPPYSFSQFWQHQLRWARTMRVSRPAGYLGIALTFGLPWSIILAMLAPQNRWSWALLVGMLLVRAGVALRVGRTILGDRQVLKDLWLLPLRDVLGLAIWIWSYAGNEVGWRGEEFRLKNGRMFPVKKDGADLKQVTVVDASSESQRR